MQRQSWTKLIVFTSLALATTACGKGRELRGYVFDKELSNAIQPGVDNRSSVESTLGTPTIGATFGDNTWYYISTTVRVRPIFWPDAKQHRVLAINFNDSGVVDSVNNYGLEDMHDIDPAPGKTPTKGRKVSFFQQIFGSIGRGGAGQAPVGAGDSRGPNG